MVFMAQVALHRSRTHSSWPVRSWFVLGSDKETGFNTVPSFARTFHTLVHRPVLQLLSLYSATIGHDLVCSRSRQQPVISFNGIRSFASVNFNLLRLLLLGIPRQSRRRKDLSLMKF